MLLVIVATVNYFFRLYVCQNFYMKHFLLNYVAQLAGLAVFFEGDKKNVSV